MSNFSENYQLYVFSLNNQNGQAMVVNYGRDSFKLHKLLVDGLLTFYAYVELENLNTTTRSCYKYGIVRCTNWLK